MNFSRWSFNTYNKTSTRIREFAKLEAIKMYFKQIKPVVCQLILWTIIKLIKNYKTTEVKPVTKVSTLRKKPQLLSNNKSTWTSIQCPTQRDKCFLAIMLYWWVNPDEMDGVCLGDTEWKSWLKIQELDFCQYQSSSSSKYRSPEPGLHQC